jgi:Rap1a immunity proteins
MGKNLSEAYDVGFCAGTITAILGLRTSFVICVPSNVAKGQVLQAILRYVEARPQRVQEEFGPLAIEALRDAWPCKK